MEQIAENVMAETGKAETPASVTEQGRKRMLFRSPSDKLIGGVCGGLAEFAGWDPALVRILWVVLTFATGGGGILAYVALLILLPVGTAEQGQVRAAALELNERNLARAAFVLMALGGLWLLANLGVLPWLWSGVWALVSVAFWPALLIGAGYVLLRYTGRGMRWNAGDAAERMKSGVSDKMPSKESVKASLRRTRQQFPLKRSRSDRVFMGVCGGIGQKIGIDANLVRLVWAAFSIGSVGMGVLIYVLAGLFLPEEQTAQLDLYQDEPHEVQIIDARAG